MEEGHFRSRMFLARSRLPRREEQAKVESGLLGAQTASKPGAGSKAATGDPRFGMVGTRCLGVRIKEDRRGRI